MPFRQDFDMIGSNCNERMHYFNVCCNCGHELRDYPRTCPNCGDDVSTPDGYEEQMMEELEREIEFDLIKQEL